MKRRRLLQYAAALPILPYIDRPGSAWAAPTSTTSRVRPGDPRWPKAPEWESLRQSVAGNLITLQSPLDACRATPGGEACRDLFRELKNPYFIGDSPALTQTCGWVGAWTAQPSVYAVAAHNAAHVAAAVDFAREKNLRLVIRAVWLLTEA
jgi:hypothetical protein